MSKIAQKTEKRTDWTLTSEEVLKGFTALQDVNNTYCDPIGYGTEYYIAPNDSLKQTMYLVFNAYEVRNAYSTVFGVDWPMQVGKEITDKEYHSMFLEVQDYVEYEYRNSYNEKKIFTVHPQRNY